MRKALDTLRQIDDHLENVAIDHNPVSALEAARAARGLVDVELRKESLRTLDVLTKALVVSAGFQARQAVRRKEEEQVGDAAEPAGNDEVRRRPLQIA